LKVISCEELIYSDFRLPIGSPNNVSNDSFVLCADKPQRDFHTIVYLISLIEEYMARLATVDNLEIFHFEFVAGCLKRLST
jgi:hypothetical protein